MRKLNSLLGKPIVTYDTGEHIGKVEQLLVDLSKGQVVGFMVSEDSRSTGIKILLLNQVQIVGPDVIIIPSHAVIMDAEQQPDILQLLKREKERRQLKILTLDGRDLGLLLDIYFNEKNGEIQGYETKGGLFAEEAFGRSFVPAPKQLQVGVEFVFVPTETIDLMTEQDLHIAQIDSASSQPPGESEPGARKFMEAEPLEPSFPRDVEQTKGRRARRSVQTPTALIVAAQGQIVTTEVIEEARRRHEEQALVQAVTLSPEEATSSRVSHFWEATGERVREEVSQVLENTAGLWERVKDTVVDVTKRNTRQQPYQTDSEKKGDESTSERRSPAPHERSEKPTSQEEASETRRL